MSDDFNDLRTSLRQATDGFRPQLDATALAETGRARSRRRMVIGGVAATLAVIAAAMVVTPALPSSRPTVAAAPAPANEVGKDPGPMAMPTSGAVVPDGFWKTVTVVTANLQLSYPPSWTASDEQWGIVRITAPRGYSIDVLTNALQETCDDGPTGTEPQIASTDLVAVTSLGSGPVVIRWHDGGKIAASVHLAQHSATRACWQKFLNYGGVDDVYVGSGDNSANPTVGELDEAVAILASATRLH